MQYTAATEISKPVDTMSKKAKVNNLAGIKNFTESAGCMKFCEV